MPKKIGKAQQKPSVHAVRFLTSAGCRPVALVTAPAHMGVAGRAEKEGDIMTQFTARVLGHGLVDWPPERVDAYAAELRAVHVPAGRWLPSRRGTCANCRAAWPCAWINWAEHWRHSLTRSEVTRT